MSSGARPADIGASAADVVVELDRVSRDFGVVEALREVDLAVRRGEVVSIIGPSGCGKSTLLRLVADLDMPTAGTIVVNGKPPPRARLDRDYGMVFQASVLFDWRTVRGNVELPLEVAGLPAADREARARALLEVVELGEAADLRPWQLSGGMAQRVAIARALALDPAILLMDEPFGALDEMTRERLDLELLRIRDRTGTTVLLVTHSVPEAVFLGDRVVVLSARPGRVVRTVPIDLPRERGPEIRDLPRFFDLVTEVREALREGEARPS